MNNKVVRGDIEMNNGGDFYAKNVNEKIKELGGHTSIRTFFTSQNKNTKIITYADFVKNISYSKTQAHIHQIVIMLNL